MAAKCLLVYASMTGNTAAMAEAVLEGANAAGCRMESRQMFELFAEEVAGYDGLLLGCYTWGDGEVPDEALDFYEELEQVPLAGMKAAVFGSGDTSYPEFAAAVDKFEERLCRQGAELVAGGLKVDRCPEAQDLAACRDFGKLFAAALAATALPERSK